MENEKSKSVLSRLNSYCRQAEALIASECSPNAGVAKLRPANTLNPARH